MIKGGGKAIYGAYNVSGLAVNRSGLTQVKYAAVTQEGAGIRSQYQVVLNGDLEFYLYEPVTITSRVTGLKGTTFPVNRKVYLIRQSTIPTNQADINRYTVAETTSDEDGEFEFDVQNMSGNYTVVFPAESRAATMTVKLEVPASQVFQYRSYTVEYTEAARGYSNPNTKFTLDASGTAAELYIAYAPDPDNITQDNIVTGIAIAKSSTGKYVVTGKAANVFLNCEGTFILYSSSGYTSSFSVTSFTWVFFDDCLSGDTKITMADGSQKELRDVKAGDMVLDASLEATRVKEVRSGKKNAHHVIYRFENGVEIDETHDHRFFNVEQGFFQRLKMWRQGEHALMADGSRAAFQSRTLLWEEAEEFGIWTESGSYFANGLLSGDVTANRYLLDEVSVEKAAEMALTIDPHDVEKGLKL